MTPREQRFVALIRGINVGSAKRVAMADLRALVADLGFGEVTTVLNSGNVIFTGHGTTASAASRIAAGLVERTGVKAAVTVVTASDLGAVVEQNPLLPLLGDPARLLVAFCHHRADLARYAPLAAQDWAPDALAVGAHAAYLWCADGILASRLADAANRALAERATTRNWATVLKLQALVASGR